MAFILESIEIKKLWPEQNRSQKRFEQAYGLYSFEDNKGYIRLCIEKKKKNLKALYTFNLLTEGYNLLKKLVDDLNFAQSFVFCNRQNIECQLFAEKKCIGACEQKESAEDYNKRVMECINHLEYRNYHLLLWLMKVYNREEQSCILIEKGKFYGMGYLPSDININE